MARRYEDRDYDRGQRDYGRRSDSDYDQSYGERSESRNRYGRDENEREGYSRESRWGEQSGRGRYSGSEYGGSEYGGRSRSGGSQHGSGQYGGGQYGGSRSSGSQYGGGQYGGSQYGSGSQSRSRGEYRGREGYRPGSENDWDYTDDNESRYGSFVRGYDTGSYDDSSRQDNWSSSSSRYNYPSGYRSGETYRDRGRGYDYDYDRRDEERGWLDRLADKLAAWFGDEDAERRYRMDDQRQRRGGKGPKSYRRSDERIREDVNDQLSEGYLDATNIEVAVAEGIVTLTGTVNSRSDKRRAEDIADEVRGVKNVENRLRVEQSDIDRYPSLHGTGRIGTTGITGTTGTTGTTETTGTTGSTESTGTARGKTAGT